MSAKNYSSMIDTAELGRAIKRKRLENGMSLRDVANETKVSASTLSRIENGTGKPDADHIAVLTKWLDMPVERVLSVKSDDQEKSPVIFFQDEPIPNIVEAHLRADPNLDPETAKALGELFRVAYKQMASPDKKSGKQ